MLRLVPPIILDVEDIMSMGVGAGVVEVGDLDNKKFTDPPTA
jgi:hypothetical protein